MSKGFEDLSDKYLLSELKEGNKMAFDILYEKHWEPVFSATYKRIENPDQAKDITQDVFLHIWLKREEITIDNLPAYLHTAVKNKVLKWMKSQQKFTPIADLLADLKGLRDEADTEILHQEFMKAYESLINTLPEGQQRIFRMRYQEDMSTIEISQELGIARKTVQNQLGKAVIQLRASLTFLILLYLHFRA